MSATGLDVFDRTVQTTDIRREEIDSRIGPDRAVAWHVLGAVLRTLRDRLPIGLAAAHLGAQLPLLVRGTCYDRWQPRAKPLKLRPAKAFIGEVNANLEGTRPANPEATTRSVFQVLNHCLDPDPVAKVRDARSKPVRRLWPDGATEPDEQTPERSLERTEP
ncbi:MAG TPA: DUF2267 domain-containing protein [Hyphomicrobiaceae bacterium]|jgi:uncharacterized protein (DUF2267 family)